MQRTSVSRVGMALATLAILPIVFFGSLASTATGYWLGLKESWI